MTLMTSTRGLGAVAKSRQSSRRSEYRKAAETVPAATATYWPALGQGEKVTYIRYVQPPPFVCSGIGGMGKLPERRRRKEDGGI